MARVNKTMDLDKLLEEVSSKLKGKSNLAETLSKIQSATIKLKDNVKDGLQKIKDKGLTADDARDSLANIKSKANSFKAGVKKSNLLVTRITKLLATAEDKLTKMGPKVTPARTLAETNIAKYKHVIATLGKVTDEVILPQSSIDEALVDIDDKSKISDTTSTEATIENIDVDVIVTEGLNGFSIKTGDSKVEVIKQVGRHEDSSVIGSSKLTILDKDGNISIIDFDSINTMGLILEIYKAKPKIELFGENFTSGFISIVGASGSGKSTLGRTIIDRYLTQHGIVLNGKVNGVLLRTAISQIISVSGEDRVVEYGDKHVEKVLFAKQPNLKKSKAILDKIAFISMNEPEAGSAQYGLYSFMASIYHAIANKDIVIIDSFKEIHTVLHGPAVTKGFTWSMSAILSKINNFALKNDCLVYGIFNPVLDDSAIDKIMDQFMKANCQGIFSLKRANEEFKIAYYNRANRGTTSHSLTPRVELEEKDNTKAVPYYKRNRG